MQNVFGVRRVRICVSSIPIAQFVMCVQENGDVGDDGLRGVQYPFSVNEKVVIKVSLFHCLSKLSVALD